jgi:hypothetical protein
MSARNGVAEPPAIGGWSKALGELHRRIGHHFARSEVRERVRRYLVGLLGRAWRLMQNLSFASSPSSRRFPG